MSKILYWIGELFLPTPGSFLQRLFTFLIAWGAIEALTDPQRTEHFWAFLLALLVAENPYWDRRLPKED